MLVLYETPAGYALFKLHDEGKLSQPENLHKHFEKIEDAKKLVSLQDFHKFADTAEALSATTALIEGNLDQSLDRFLQKSILDNRFNVLAVADKKLGTSIKEKFPSLDCPSDSSVMELFRCIRFQLTDLLSAEGKGDVQLNTMSLSLAHSLGRYKLKFSPDKIDVMLVQAISLLDDLDKEINVYSMRVKEWYGWHFPELTRIISDNLTYAKIVQLVGTRPNFERAPLETILETHTATLVRKAASVSMGTEITEEDVSHIKDLCNQVIEIFNYRDELNDYIRNRMKAIAPNLMVLVGELVGARLIAHAGSLMNLAKHPASTVQILGAEKALFRALKTKKSTPKYGLIYHASLVNQATPKNKGKLSRILANKAALSVRVDALGSEENLQIGQKSLEKVTARLQEIEGQKLTPLTPQQQKPFVRSANTAPRYNSNNNEVKFDYKRKRNQSQGEDDQEHKKFKQ